MKQTDFATENALQVFTSDTFGTIRTIQLDGEPWFVAADVCKALELSSTATRRLDDDEKGLRSMQTLGGNQDISIVNESGLYSLVLGSRKPEAKAFKRWITHEVIPAIRKHGAYMDTKTIEEVLLSPETIIKIATQLKEEKEKRVALEKENVELRPKAAYCDLLTSASNAVPIKELSVFLCKSGVMIGRNKLFALLRQDGYLCKDGASYNLPTQRALDAGYLIAKQSAYFVNRVPQLGRTTYVTAKGKAFFLKKYSTIAGSADLILSTVTANA